MKWIQMRLPIPILSVCNKFSLGNTKFIVVWRMSARLNRFGAILVGTLLPLNLYAVSRKYVCTTHKLKRGKSCLQVRPWVIVAAAA